MDNTLLQQLEGLFLGAVPTVILFLLLYAAYLWIVHRPLKKILEERYSRSEGALVKARADIAAAAAKTHEYEEKLREARLAIFKAQDARRHKVLEVREAALADARERAQQMVREAQTKLAADAAAVRTSLQQDVEKLAAEIVRRVVRPVATPLGGPR